MRKQTVQSKHWTQSCSSAQQVYTAEWNRKLFQRFKLLLKTICCLLTCVGHYWCYRLISCIIILARDKSSNLLLSNISSLLCFCMLPKQGGTTSHFICLHQETQPRERERERDCWFLYLDWGNKQRRWSGPSSPFHVPQVSFYFNSNLLSKFLPGHLGVAAGAKLIDIFCLV